MNEQSVNEWYSELRQNGLLISSPILDSWLVEGPLSPEERKYEQLRDAYTTYITRSEANPSDHTVLYLWLDTVFEQFLGHDPAWWQKYNQIDERFVVDHSSFSGAKLRPDRVLCIRGDLENPRFLVSY